MMSEHREGARAQLRENIDQWCQNHEGENTDQWCSEKTETNGASEIQPLALAPPLARSGARGALAALRWLVSASSPGNGTCARRADDLREAGAPRTG